MRQSRTLWGLVALNALLACAMAWKFTPDNVAHAQAPPPGDYLMVPARVSGANNGVVYVIDTRNGLLGGFAYNDNRKALESVPALNLRRIFEAGAGVGR